MQTLTSRAASLIAQAAGGNYDFADFAETAGSDLALTLARAGL
jgi:hypothetical protein